MGFFFPETPPPPENHKAGTVHASGVSPLGFAPLPLHTPPLSPSFHNPPTIYRFTTTATYPHLLFTPATITHHHHHHHQP